MQLASEIGSEVEEREHEANLVRAAQLELELRCVVGMNVARIRTAQGMTQKGTLARMLTTTTDAAARANSYKLENGRTTMTIHRMSHVAAVLGVSWRDLVIYPTTSEGRKRLGEMVAKESARRGIALAL